MLSFGDPALKLKDLFIDAGLGYSLATFLSTLAMIVIIALLSWLSNVIAKATIRKIVLRIVKRSKSQWDDIFFEQKVFTRLSHFAPALIIHFSSGMALGESLFWLNLVHTLNYIYMLCIGMMVMLSFIESWHLIYQLHPISRHRNIKGYVQLVKIVVVIITILIIISVVFEKDITTIIAGLSAMAAVLILVFKDTLLGFVGSIQLAANDMLKVGEWISMPSRHVDGIVTDITLNTVKVQNFDKTILTIPTYALVSETFQNWTGMESSGVRQIKRAIYIDQKSVRFAETDLLRNLSESVITKDFIGRFAKEIKNLTNLGLFRYYAEDYLRHHPLVDREGPVIVRHRDPDITGLPVQVYAFTTDNQFVPFEHIQSEIFEHLLAILDLFGLKVSQHPTGGDILELSAKSEKN